MNNKSSYVFSADVIRMLAIFGVIIIHTTNAVYTRLDFFGGVTWWVAVILDSISRISIPLFIMLSGYLLLNKDESIEKSLKRILNRIAIPFIFWLFFYVWLGTGIPSLNRINLSIFQKIFYVDVNHLYFLVIIIGLYFVSPMIRAYLRVIPPISQDFFMKSLLILGVLMVTSQFIFNFCTSENFFTRWVPYTGLFVAGYVLGNKKKGFGHCKLLIIYLLSLSATLFFNYLFYFLSIHHYKFLSSPGCLSHYTDHYLSVNVLIMSLSAFLLLLNFGYKTLKENTTTNKLVNSIARASFGIYLLQPAVARFLEIQFHLAVDFSQLPILVIIILKLFLVFIISYTITISLSKIPFARYVVGYGK